MKTRFAALLKMRGIHGLVVRYGPKWMRVMAFDEKYRSGDWDFSRENSSELVQLVADRAHHGDILIMGCGGASFLAQLDPASYNSILGIDLSTEAVRLARQHASSRVRFEIADMTQFEWKQPYDVILFSESINYVCASVRKQLLVKLSQCLKPDGCFIVTIAQPSRYEAILTMIRENFDVLEDRNFQGLERRLLVFRGAAKAPLTVSAAP